MPNPTSTQKVNVADLVSAYSFFLQDRSPSGITPGIAASVSLLNEALTKAGYSGQAQLGRMLARTGYQNSDFAKVAGDYVVRAQQASLTQRDWSGLGPAPLQIRDYLG